MVARQPTEERFRSNRVFQRCPNCALRADVSLHVAGALIRCTHCNVRFQVERPPSSLHPHAPDDPTAWEELAAVGNPNPLSAAKGKPPSAPSGSAPNQPKSMPHIEGFTLHERLGQGGMGEVFRAIRQSDGRELAVKVLSESLAAVPDYVRRFDREAAAMAQLDHPGIVRLLSRGKSGAHCFIAMELVPGPSLRTHVAVAKPSARALARLLGQVAHALAYAHARGVVHRDLKPDNVLVIGEGRTKVLDFGLAGLHADGAESLTQSNVAMGTANYMAPEQRKDAHRADHRADLYSFGVMIYELLTGELPAGKYPLRRSLRVFLAPGTRSSSAASSRIRRPVRTARWNWPMPWSPWPETRPWCWRRGREKRSARASGPSSGSAAGWRSPSVSRDFASRTIIRRRACERAYRSFSIGAPASPSPSTPAACAGNPRDPSQAFKGPPGVMVSRSSSADRRARSSSSGTRCRWTG